MVDIVYSQFEAMKHAGKMGGEYLESINKTDCRELTKQEWQQFIFCICNGFAEEDLRIKRKNPLSDRIVTLPIDNFDDEIPF